MIKSVLIIDDERPQAEGLATIFTEKKPDYVVNYAYEEEDIVNKIENLFYNVAIVDLRMDKFSQNGFDFINKIIEVNPFAKIIIVSAFLLEYSTEISNLISTGKVQALIPKGDFDSFTKKIFTFSDLIVSQFEQKLYVLNSKALANLYAQAKNEKDTYKKGTLFEDFIILLFTTIGFRHIYNRVIDLSRNEVDIIIRNEISDEFIHRFGKYILIECKNKQDTPINKNDFIVFQEKLKNTNGLASLGIMVTPGYIASTTYTEAIRSSKGDEKIIFISNPEIERIIHSENYLEEFKKIIDFQVKDNKGHLSAE